jgi:hypothetical protein
MLAISQIIQPFLLLICSSDSDQVTSRPRITMIGKVSGQTTKTPRPNRHRCHTTKPTDRHTMFSGKHSITFTTHSQKQKYTPHAFPLSFPPASAPSHPASGRPSSSSVSYPDLPDGLLATRSRPRLLRQLLRVRSDPWVGGGEWVSRLLGLERRCCGLQEWRAVGRCTGCGLDAGGICGGE